jgi:hypothetical protein
MELKERQELHKCLDEIIDSSDTESIPVSALISTEYIYYLSSISIDDKYDVRDHNVSKAMCDCVVAHIVNCLKYMERKGLGKFTVEEGIKEGSLLYGIMMSALQQLDQNRKWLPEFSLDLIYPDAGEFND